MRIQPSSDTIATAAGTSEVIDGDAPPRVPRRRRAWFPSTHADSCEYELEAADLELSSSLSSSSSSSPSSLSTFSVGASSVETFLTEQRPPSPPLTKSKSLRHRRPSRLRDDITTISSLGDDTSSDFNDDSEHDDSSNSYGSFDVAANHSSRYSSSCSKECGGGGGTDDDIKRISTTIDGRNLNQQSTKLRSTIASAPPPLNNNRWLHRSDSDRPLGAAAMKRRSSMPRAA